MLTPLNNRAYARLFSAHLVALIGTGLLTVALGLLAVDIGGTRAATIMGLAMSVKMIAYVFASPLMAAAVDRFDTKAVLIASDIIRAGIALCLPFVTYAWQIYALIFILQIASATFTPRFQALIPSLLDDEETYTQALSLSRLAYDTEALLSPLLAAALLTVTSYHNLFVGTAAGFVFSAACVASTALPAAARTPQPAQGSFFHRAGIGLRTFRRSRALTGLAWLNLAIAAPMSIVIVATPDIVQNQLGRTQADVAILLAFFGIGSMAIALILPRILARTPQTGVMLAGAATAITGLLTMSSALLSTTHLSWPTLCLAWLITGAGLSAMLTPSSRLITQHTTAEQRSTTFAAQFALSHACYLITYPLVGFASSAIGIGPTITICTLIAGGAAIMAASIWWTNPCTAPHRTRKHLATA
ncbi:hypothetical protein CAQU_10680 [Corynebacterium aquilae DSM 44791]|uniref:Major facilitator transporter n=2 Tax=Corynebacterium aquilae TaxID=203263 RepID=A0A1L7CHU6_9CORY|nr:hypothetical protein CAQU_10680 [Corynebacterium aquilae DSM 44791]